MLKNAEIISRVVVIGQNLSLSFSNHTKSILDIDLGKIRYKDLTIHIILHKRNDGTKGENFREN